MKNCLPGISTPCFYTFLASRKCFHEYDTPFIILIKLPTRGWEQNPFNLFHITLNKANINRILSNRMRPTISICNCTPQGSRPHQPNVSHKPTRSTLAAS